MTYFQSILFTSFLLLGSTPLRSQENDSSYVLFKNIAVEARFLVSDKLQQIYIIDEANNLIKYNTDGVEVFRYNNNRLGFLERVDVSNPFHLLLFYPDYGTLISLDRTLSPTGTYLLADLGILQTHAVGIASDNNIWIYDDLDFRLRKYDRQGRVLIESQDFGMLLPQAVSPTSILEKNNLVFLYDKDSGLLVFDIFGQFLKTIPLPPLAHFQIIDKHVVALHQGQVTAWQLSTGIANTINLPFLIPKNSQLRLEQNRVFLLNQEEVKMYKKN